MFITLSLLEPPMEKTCKIVRTSMYSFFQRYHYFTSIAALLALPFSLSVLLSQGFIPTSSSSLQRVFNRIEILFLAAGFPSSEFLNVVNLKIFQTISSFIFTLPFTLTFLLIAKASVIQALKHDKRSSIQPSYSYFVSLYNPLLTTYVCNTLVILSANATAFALLFLAFNCLEGFGFTSRNSLIFLSAAGTVLYSFVLANIVIVCNLALVVSGMERCRGYMAILRACVLIRRRRLMALLLAVPVNLAFAACEALFNYRILRSHHVARRPSSSLALEGLFIAYLYSILVILDTIISCIFFKSCKKDCVGDQESSSYQLKIVEEGGSDCSSLKGSGIIPQVAI